MNYTFLSNIVRKNKEYRSLLNSLSGKYRSDSLPYYINGISEGFESIFLSALAEDTGNADSPLFLVFDDSKKALSFSEFLTGTGICSRYLTEREYCFSNIVSSHDFEEQRLCVFSSLISKNISERPSVICTTPAALLQITLHPSVLDKRCIHISQNSPLDIEELSVSLTSSGYIRVDLVEAPGQFAIRGGIIDVFFGTDNPVRIELFGDEIDRVGYFSIETQRFTDNISDDIVIPPVRELLPDATAKETLKTLISSHIKKLGKHPDEAVQYGLQVLESELTSINNDFDINFADKYLPVILPEAVSALEYIKGKVIIINSSSCREKFDAQKALTEQSLLDLSEHFALPSMKNGIYFADFDGLLNSSSFTTLILDSIPRDISQNSENIYIFNTKHIPSYSKNVQLLTEDVDRFYHNGYLCCIVCESEIEKNSLSEHFMDLSYTVMNADRGSSDFGIPSKLPLVFMTGDCISGFEIASPKFVLLNYSHSGTKITKGSFYRSKKRKNKPSEAIMSYADLNVGDYVVHEAYGIGQYMGLDTLTVSGSTRDYVKIIFAGDDKLFLPIDQLEHVSKYIGTGSDTGTVKLSKMGGAEWKRSTSRAKEATKQMAKELLELYAKRKKTQGIAFDPDDYLSDEFASSFQYEETESQLAAISDVKKDMESPVPMDRLLCGDVGYGKTEVALRAAFKAAISGKQVAVLVPTTILAYQHYQTFISRLRDFPVRVDMMSRFKSKKELDISVRRLARGDTDIIIGTHRIISKDITFKDLGLIIIDEEQRFGVAQKEKLKSLALNADILTLTATPIPRTLSMAMGGIVDMSILDEAPGLRSPVQTYVLEHDDSLINEAIRRELRRNGQVFYLYNNVEGIYSVADRIARAVPEARIAVAHGQMDKEDIEDVWSALINKEIDILVCTTIIETGIDVPNANTLIIENADRYGLSQLHQIRGRVGRSSTKAFAFFTYKKNKQLTEIAEKRLTAIKEYTEFGAGFRIALRDLEIRGAGNLLGPEQHGHLDAIGYDLYLKLLDEAVCAEKGEPKEAPKPDCAIDIRCDAYLTESYIHSTAQRMDMYKRIALIENENDYNDIIDEMCDRYGEPNSQAVNLCRIARIRALGRDSGFSKIEENNGVIKLYTASIDANAVQNLSRELPKCGIRVVLGSFPYVSLRNYTNLRNTEFLISLLEKYRKACAQ